MMEFVPTVDVTIDEMAYQTIESVEWLSNKKKRTQTLPAGRHASTLH